MKFTKWVLSKGINTVAKRLEVRPNTVQFWLYGYRTPRKMKIKKLLTMGKGSFSFEDIIKETTRKQ